MSPSVVLGKGILGEKDAAREARAINNGQGGGAIQLGPGILKPDAIEEEPEEPAESFTLLQAEELLEKDPANWVRVLKAEGARATVRKSIAKAVIKATDGKTIVDEEEDEIPLLPIDVYESLKQVIAGRR